MSDNLAQLSEPMTLMRTKDVKHLADRIEELEAKLDDTAWAVWMQFKHWEGEKKFALREVVKFLKGDKNGDDTGS